MTNKLIVNLGPTGSGKTGLSVKLAKKFNGEVVCADSRQIYKQMDIATGKTTKQEMQGVPHYLMDFLQPNEEFSLALYKKKAIEKIRDIQYRGKVPFLVGGTGLYSQAIVDNFKIPEVAPDKKLRNKIEKNIKQQGLEKVYQNLIKLDPKAKVIVQPDNPRRIIRALEVCLKTGKPFSDFYKKGSKLFDVLQIGLKIPREKLYKKIDCRVDQMVEQGLVDEVKKLVKKYSFDLASMSGIGYKEIADYLQGNQSLEEAVKKIKFRTHQYARRQLSWFRRDKSIHWVEGYQEAEKIVKKFLT